MLDPKTLLRASIEAGKDLMTQPIHHVLEALGGQDGMTASPGAAIEASQADRAVGAAQARELIEGHSKTAPLMVPIRALDETHRTRIAAHLLALDGADRYLRFGYAATDEQIGRYVDSLNFERDEIFGVYNRKLELVAMAHLAFIGKEAAECLDSCAEFGVSVHKDSRGLGLGSALFDRAAMHARNDGIHLMFIHALSENGAMINIARKAGATVEQLGSESEAYLRLGPATLDSRLTEIVQEQVAQVDYRLKAQAKQFWAFWANVQERVRAH